MTGLVLLQYLVPMVELAGAGKRASHAADPFGSRIDLRYSEVAPQLNHGGMVSYQYDRLKEHGHHYSEL